jgi:hypothetical protein
LAEPEITVRRVVDLSVVQVASPDGSPQGDQAVMITLPAGPAEHFAALTATDGTASG